MAEKSPNLLESLRRSIDYALAMAKSCSEGSSDRSSIGSLREVQMFEGHYYHPYVRAVSVFAFA